VEKSFPEKHGFEFITFEVMGHVMETFPQSYRVWICNEVYHFAGMNGMLSEVDWSVENV
jgi:hypothetical protein